MPALITMEGKYVPVKVWSDFVEAPAAEQLKNTASLPWVFKHVAAMADCHFGKGATVGSVVAMKDAVSPAAVGVDIGCGMGAALTSLKAADLPEDLKKVRHQIEREIPVGFYAHKQDRPAWLRIGPAATELAMALLQHYKELDATVRSAKMEEKAVLQLGTLGGGNHFIEICLDEEDRVWFLLHSGSRNVGKTLAEAHIARARALAHNKDLPDPDLAVFLADTPQMKAYRRDLFWAQQYAQVNRKLMMALMMNAVQQALQKPFLVSQQVWCHHNYVSEEKHFGEKVLVTRKGAISADWGEMGIIPGSMGTKSYIVRGLGNEESFKSASHGAGRRMSRGQARRSYTVEDLKAQTHGVECRKDTGVLDEIPAAYKDVEKVMEQQKDLVEIVHTLKAILCVKGD